MPDPIVAVMGITGAGKSSFIQHVTANREECGECALKEEYAGEGTHSVTQEAQLFKDCCRPSTILFSYAADGIRCQETGCSFGHDKEFFLIDTPGFNDTERLDTDVLKELADWLLESYRDGVKINGILYLHRISEVRMEGSAMRNLLMFRKLCGKDSVKNVTPGPTSWNLVGEKEGAAHVEELLPNEGFFKAMTDQGCGSVRVSGNCDADRELHSRFAVKSPSVMELQKGLLSGKSLAKTAAVSATSRKPAELQIQNFFGYGDCPSIGFALESLSEESESEPTEREGHLLYLGARERRDQFYEKFVSQIDRIRSTVDLVEDLLWSLGSLTVRPCWKCCYWPQQTLQWMLPPLEQKNFVGVVPCQILRRAENPTFSKRIYSFVGALYWEGCGVRMFSSASGRDDPHRPQPPPAKMSPDDDDEDGHFGFCKATNWEVAERASNSTTQVRADRQWSVDASTIAIWKAVIMRTCIHHFRVQRPGPCSGYVESRSRGGGHHVIGDALRTARLCA